ncbi:MAG TPA: hypothetical protein VK578_18930 [Edaphobacter sp.]|nr:hypothetical protein [Edaphobacter sp.]
MDFNDEVPRITKPTKQAPTAVSRVYDDCNFVDGEGTQVVQGHYWRRVLGTNIPCDNAVTLTISAKAGISHALLTEVANALEVGVAPLKNTLSLKTSIGDTFTNERTIGFTRNVGPKPCIGITFAEWQKFVFSVLRRQKYFLWFKSRVVEQTVDIGTEETFADQFEYPDPSCCRAGIQEQVSNGFDQIFTLNFGSISFAVLAKDKQNGNFGLAGIPGEFRAGQVVSLDVVRHYLASHGHSPQTEVRLSNSLGAVNDFYGWTETKRRAVEWRPLPWLIALGCTSLVVYMLRRTRERIYVSNEEAIEGLRRREMLFPKKTENAVISEEKHQARKTETASHGH